MADAGTGITLERAMEGIKALIKNGAGLRTHSGSVGVGDVFVALPGVRVDGAQFIGTAMDRGAKGIVHAASVAVQPRTGVRILAVDNPARSLGELARVAFGTENRVPKVIGITGTNGKTTVAHLVYELLAHNGIRAGLMGTVATQWGTTRIAASMTTPDCLALHELVGRMTQDNVTHLVMEVSSHALDQDRLAGLPVQIGVFTNLTQDHLDYHGSMERYAEAKAKLFTDGSARCAKGAVNVDDPYGRELLRIRPDMLGFGLHPSARLSGRIVESGPWGMRLAMAFEGKTWELRTPLIGRHNASNLLASQAVGLLSGFGVEQLAVLAEATGAPGRLERVPNTRGLDVFVDYAHTPDALEHVAATLKAMDFRRLVVVFGCGGDRDASKRPLMGRAVGRYADIAVLTSDNPRTEDPEAILDQVEPGLVEARQVIREVDRRTAIKRALACMTPGDALLIAGKGHEDYQVIGTTKTHFSDFEVVRELLA